MRRFFSTFAYGRVGAALLTMRVVAAVALIDRGFEGLRAASRFGIGALPLLTIVAGAFLLLGLWTPVAGTIAPIFANTGRPPSLERVNRVDGLRFRSTCPC